LAKQLRPFLDIKDVGYYYLSVLFEQKLKLFRRRKREKDNV